MNKYPFARLLPLLFTLISCQTLEELSIDYRVPAEVSFPAELTRVAVVNNCPAPTESRFAIGSDTTFYPGGAALATTALAEAIANENYFDQVVVCDSALRSPESSPQTKSLSQEEVEELTQSLDADFIVALEAVPLKISHSMQYLTDWSCYQGVIDIKAYPVVKVYLPERKGPMVTLQQSDSIFWEAFGLTTEEAERALPKESKLLEEASRFAGTVPVNQLLPTWKTGKRYLYINGSVQMRDARVYVQKEEWEKAYQLWQAGYQSAKSDAKKMAAAHNIALYYEMQDSLERAEEWATQAVALARRVEKIEEKQLTKSDLLSAPNYRMIAHYLEELKERRAGLFKLTIQMARFKDDF